MIEYKNKEEIMVLFKQNSDESIEVYTFDQNNYLISK